MKYQCVQNHVFNHPAKLTQFFEAREIHKDEDTTINAADTLESSVCPICHCKTFSEFVEPEADYTDWAQVQHSQVKEKLDLGWKVLSHTKDNVVMAKIKETKKP